MIFKGKKVELRPPVGEKIQYMSNHSYTVYKRVSDTDREWDRRSCRTVHYTTLHILSVVHYHISCLFCRLWRRSYFPM